MIRSIETFSKRHVQMWEQGASSQADIHKDFYAGRRAKDMNLDRASLKAEWSRACEAVCLRGMPVKPERGAVLGGPAASVEAEVAALTEKSVSLRLQDLQSARLGSKLGEGPSQDVLEESASYAMLSLVAGKTARTYTTPEALGLEASYRADVVAGISKASVFLDEDRCDALRERLRAGNQLSKRARNEAVSGALRAAEELGVREPVRASLRGALDDAIEGGEKLAPKALYKLRREVEDQLRSEGRKGKALTAALRGILDPFERRAQAMTEGQIEAVCATARSRDGVIVWRGVAGAGKTFPMSRVVEIARDAGYEPKGFAPSAAAAAQLSTDTGIAAITIDAHLLRLESSRKEGGRSQEERHEPAAELWIVDEASMLSARAFAALTAHARERGARLLLVGDERQISAVEAGNPFLDVQRETKTTFASLSESVRQRTPQLQRVVSHLYADQHPEAAKGLRQETLEAPTREARCKLAAKSYLAMPRGEQAQTLLLASTNEERRLVTAEVRAGLAARGRLGTEATVTTLRAIEFSDIHKRQAANYLPGYVVKFQGGLPRWARRSEAYEVASIDVKANTVRLRDANRKERVVAGESLACATLYRKETLAFAKGDRVVWTQNDRRLGVMNNDRFEVSKVSKTGVTLQSAAGGRKGRHTLSPGGLHHLDHAWALTVYRSQGQTSKNVILVADEGMSARELLVGVTRATQGILIVAHDREDIEKLAAKKDGKLIAHEVMVRKEPETLTQERSGHPPAEKCDISISML